MTYARLTISAQGSSGNAEEVLLPCSKCKVFHATDSLIQGTCEDCRQKSKAVTNPALSGPG